MSTRFAPHLALAALCAALAAALWLAVGATDETTGPALATAPVRSYAPVPPLRPEPAFALPPLEAFGDIVARPLFWASRRPIAPVEHPAAAPSDLALVGVVRAEGKAIALIRHGKPPRVERVPEGAALEGWTVSEVAVRGVILMRGATRVELKPKLPPPQSPAAAGGAKPAGTPSPPSAQARPGD